MELTDTELRKRLLACNYAAPPITSASRQILLKKLEILERGKEMKSSNNEEPVDDNDDDVDDNDDDVDDNDDDVANEMNTQPANYDRISSPRYRSQKSNFIPENVGMYSRCFARHIDFWDKIGFFGTSFILIIASVVLFFGFKTMVQWSDRRFRSVFVNDPLSPKCSQGGIASMTCVPNADFKFTMDNLNLIRSAIHAAVIEDRCDHANYKSKDFVGMYPLFRDAEVINLLSQKFNFKEDEAKKLLQNAKVLFKANPQYDVKVLNEGILYRNYRLLRTCSFSSWKDSIYQHAIYAVVSFALVLITYRTHRWVSKLRNEGDQERRRLIKDIADILKQNEKLSDTNYISVKQVQEWISYAVELKPKLWDEVMTYIQTHDTGIVIEKQHIRGQQCDVFRLQN